MSSPFWYLTLCTFRNRWQARLRRLREPRYLMGSIAGAAYFYFFLLRPRPAGRRGGFGSMLAAAQNVEPLVLAGALVLLILAALAWWLRPGKAPVLGITASDIQFLLTAPVARPRILRYRALRSQAAALGGSAFIALVFRPATVSAGLTMFAGICGLTMIVTLYSMGVAATRASLRQRPDRPLLRPWLPRTVAAAAVAVVAVSLAREWFSVGAPATLTGALTGLQHAGSAGLAGLILAPFKAVARLPLSSTPAAFSRALPAWAGLWAIAYEWVVRSDVALGEPATDDVGPRVRPQAKPGDPGAPTRSAPFRLGPRGRPETAILWKNLILVARGAKMSGLLRLSSMLIVFGVVLARRGSNDVTTIVWIASLALAAMTTVMGPQIARNDLRQDLAHLATLKTWPLSGAVIVRGELMGPTVVLTLTAWLLLALAATVAGAPVAQFKVPGISGLSVVVAAMVLVPGLVLLQVTLHNALALMFPAWAQIGATRTAGVEHMGQRLVLVYGGLFAVLIAILPAAVIVLVVGFAIRQVTRFVPLVPLALLALGVLLVEAGAAIELLGRRFDNMDAGALPPAE